MVTSLPRRKARAKDTQQVHQHAPTPQNPGEKQALRRSKDRRGVHVPMRHLRFCVLRSPAARRP